jgi:hypothetical protein
MMPKIHLTQEDLIHLRFAHRPLLEIPCSYRVFINPDYQAPHQRWVEYAHRALYGIEFPYLDALIARQGYIPDFLTPTPVKHSVSIEDDLETVLASPDDLIRKNVRWLIMDEGETEMRRFFISHPREAVRCLVD